ncbi:MAG: WD40 repeat domain-containing protein, partial [Acetobacteraceae bacterium]|nr:WD40 repeat domain-containing protein [Acetobacteraceae bacterium]
MSMLTTAMRFLLRALALLLALLPLVPAAGQDLSGHGGPVRALAVLPAPGGGGPMLASAGFDHAVILWDPARGAALRVLRWHGGAVNALLALPGGGLASAGEDGRIALWHEPLRQESPAAVLEGHGAPVAGLALAAQGSIASAGWDGTVRVWPAGAQAEVLEGHAGPVNAVAALPAGEAAARLASAGHDGTLRLWERRGGAWDGRVLREFGTPQTALLALPDGGVASAGADGVIRLVAADGGLRVLEAGTRPVLALAVSPDGATLAAASLGGSVDLWSLPEGRLRHTLQGPGQPFWSLAFHPDGRSLWTGGQDRRVRRWDVATGAALGPLAPGGEETGAGPAAAAAV